VCLVSRKIAPAICKGSAIPPRLTVPEKRNKGILTAHASASMPIDPPMRITVAAAV
jgi:hypothetical protein